MTTVRNENLEMAVLAYKELNHNLEDSLARAHRFGQIVHALAYTRPVMCTVRQIAGAIERKPPTVSMYAKLYTMYPVLKDLLDTAEENETWDVSRLTGRNPLYPIRYVFTCSNCGSHSISKERESAPPAETAAPAAVLTEAS